MMFPGERVLARISKMSVQNNNSCPDLVSQLLQILIIIPTTFVRLLFLKGQFTHKPCHRRCFSGKIFGYCPQKSKW